MRAYGQIKDGTYQFLTGSTPTYLVVSDNGNKLGEQLTSLQAGKEWFLAYYTVCEVTKGGELLHASSNASINSLAQYKGSCNYYVYGAPQYNTSKVVLLCSVQSGESVTALTSHGFFGFSETLDFSPMKKTPAECPVPSGKWGPYLSSSVQDSQVARLPLLQDKTSLITFLWINGKPAFMTIDTGASFTGVNFKTYGITAKGSIEAHLANGTPETKATGVAEICYVANLCVSSNLWNTEAPDPLLGLSLLGQFNKVTLDLDNGILELLYREKKQNQIPPGVTIGESCTNPNGCTQ
jgi:hypothetical protein